jgi:hypothetical protein
MRPLESIIDAMHAEQPITDDERAAVEAHVADLRRERDELKRNIATARVLAGVRLAELEATVFAGQEKVAELAAEAVERGTYARVAAGLNAMSSVLAEQIRSLERMRAEDDGRIL